MIKPGEIDKIAVAQSVRATQIQKDYVISWILWGISQNDFLKENMVFKGGTCLKKIHFDDYRFSEDMDFTLLNDEVSNDEIIENFNATFKEVLQASRIPLSIADGSFDIHKDSGSIKFKIDYEGPHGKDSIKVDITRGEKMVFDVENRKVFNQYSDLEEEDEIIIKSYSLNEVLVEKMAALMGRTIPRDLYDFDYLLEEEGLKLEDVFIEFMLKAENKSHDPKNLLAKVSAKEATFKRDWETSLSNQMKKEDLPEFKNLWRKALSNLKEAINLMEK
jgi:predicted nucleotidyltransferase component of viral defense system